MRKAVLLLVLLSAACGNGDNVIIGGIAASSITPPISFENVNSVISGRIFLRDADGNSTGVQSEAVIISDRPGLCDRLAQHPEYFRTPPETYLALILFLPGDNRLGTFFPGRLIDAGTDSEIIGVGDTKVPVAPFKLLQNYGYISLRDWSDSPGGEAAGSFSLAYVPPPELASNLTSLFAGKFKSTVCPTLDGTLLP